jgi:Putative Ig domain
MDRSKLVHPLPRRLWARILLSAAVALAAPSAHAYQRWHTLTISGTPPTSVTAGQSYAFTPTANDWRTRTLVFAIANAPAWANFSSQTGQLTGTPGASSVGTYAGIVIAVSDGSRTATLPPFTVQVLAAATAPVPAPAAPPVISGTPPTSVMAGSGYAFQPSASDPAGKLLSFSVQNKPTWANFSSASGRLDGTPSSAQTGTYASIVISASDGTSASALPSFNITVMSPPPPTPPVISGTPPTSVMAGSGYAFQPSASDPAGKPLSFSVQNKPAWANFSIASGRLDGTPSSAQTGTYASIVISASDGTAASALPAFSVTVMSPPVTTGSAVLGLTPPTQNSDGSALTDLAGMRVYYGTSASSLTQVLDMPGAAATTYTLSNLTSGTWYFAATAYTSGGQESSPSATASKSIP